MVGQKAFPLDLEGVVAAHEEKAGIFRRVNNYLLAQGHKKVSQSLFLFVKTVS